MKNRVLFLLIMLCSIICVAEKLDNIIPNQLRFREMVATRTSAPPIIDGIIDDEVWEKRVSSFIELRFLEHDIQMVAEQMPKMVVDVHIVDSRVERVSSFLVIFSIYNYSISEPMYYRSMADTLITKKLMTSKIFSHEIMGQTSSQNLYRDVEKSINQLISMYLDQWYRDNPMSQF